MERNNGNGAGDISLRLFPIFRRLVFEAFDAQDTRLTRTQQVILCVMSEGDTFSMTELAKLIKTSNEQATRAVSQLVEAGYVERAQNPMNHRIVNIKLTDKAMKYLKGVNDHAARSFSADLSDSSERIENFLSELYALLRSKDL